MSYSLKVPKDYRAAVRAAQEAGWTITVPRMGHPKLTAPDGYATPIPTSSGSWRLRKEFLNRLRKHGVDV